MSAEVQIKTDLAPYYEIEVAFNALTFPQLITTQATGEALGAQLQTYADDYEQAFNAEQTQL
jgi:hypothetical protein